MASGGDWGCRVAAAFGVAGWSLAPNSGAVRWWKDPAMEGFFPETIETWVAAAAPDHRESLGAALAAAPAADAPWSLDVALRLPSGTEVWWRLVGHVETLPDGQRFAWGGIQDITAERSAAVQLERQRRQIQSVIEGPNLGTWEWNVQTGETRFNQRWAEIIGYDLEELEPVSIQTWVAHTHPDDLERSNQLLEAHFRGDTALYDCQCRMRHKDGRWVWVHDRGKIIGWTDDRRPLWVAGTHQDITDLKAGEERQARLQADLHQAQKLESIGRLAGGIAHDFNNLLGVILGRTGLLLEQMSARDPARGDVQDIHDAAERSANLTRQLLAFSRQQPSQPRVVDAPAMVHQVAPLLRRMVGEAAALSFDIEPQVPPICIDPSQFDQILTNLVVNARDAVGGSGRITVEVSSHQINSSNAEEWGVTAGPALELVVRDDGVGMTSEVVARAFEPFFTTKAAGQGTGLGLSTVYGIVRQNGGHIQISSRPGHGTSVRVLLPASGAALAVASRTVLLVEDEPMLLDLLRAGLQRSGYRVLAAAGAVAAVELAQASAFPLDLLVTDVVLPGGNGRELAEALRAQHPRLRTLFISGHAGQNEHGSFLQKPFAMVDFTRAVESSLSLDAGVP